jgi:hypothetical protein
VHYWDDVLQDGTEHVENAKVGDLEGTQEFEEVECEKGVFSRVEYSRVQTNLDEVVRGHFQIHIVHFSENLG